MSPADWFAFRVGAYKNIAASGVGPVITAGLTFGKNWLSMDLDAAVSPETGKYKGQRYPREGKVQLSLNSRF